MVPKNLEKTASKSVQEGGRSRYEAVLAKPEHLTMQATLIRNWRRLLHHGAGHHHGRSLRGHRGDLPQPRAL
jgi:hypothetical protein